MGRRRGEVRGVSQGREKRGGGSVRRERRGRIGEERREGTKSGENSVSQKEEREKE